MSFDADDIAMFIDPDMPGYVLASVDGVDVGALFSNAFRADLGMAGSVPTLKLVAADAPSVAEDSSIVIAGASYRVIGSPEPNGRGMVMLPLEEAA